MTCMIFPEKVGERQNNIQESLSTLTQLDNFIVTTETLCQVEDYGQQLDNLTKNFGTNPTNEHNDDSLEGLLPCDLFLKKMTMIMRRDIARDVIQVRNKPLHMRWMITLRL